VTILAATGEEGLKCKASNLIQWHAIVEAHRRGLRHFDVGGIEPEAQPGVYHFKLGVGGEETSIPGPFQAAPVGVRGRFVPAIERLYRWSRGERFRA
jgi:lipid II:glycine glycyltransferase (peptidoglycan interpeptide bridge formation enzyme)